MSSIAPIEFFFKVEYIHVINSQQDKLLWTVDCLKLKNFRRLVLSVDPLIKLIGKLTLYVNI